MRLRNYRNINQVVCLLLGDVHYEVNSELLEGVLKQLLESYMGAKRRVNLEHTPQSTSSGY